MGTQDRRRRRWTFGERAERNRDRTDPHPGMLTVEQGLRVVALQAPCPSNRHRTIWASKILARCDSTAQSGCDVASGEKCSCTSFHSSPELTNTMVACCLSSVGEPFIMPVK